MPPRQLKVASSLVEKGLAREIRAKADAPVWHENDDGRFALKITKAGREAIGVDRGSAGRHVGIVRQLRRREIKARRVEAGREWKCAEESRALVRGDRK